MKKIWVLKENGDREEFSAAKVERALRRSGLSGKEAEKAIALLQEKIYDGIPTSKVYSIVYGIVNDLRPEVSHRYNLKRALFDIGPAGYEFEDFVSRLLSCEGYGTKLRQLIQGRCVVHEIDVVAEKNRKRTMVECKFHNQPGTKCAIQTALYVYGRFLDLVEGGKAGSCEHFDKPMVVTNTKFSSEVIRYCECMQIPLLGWHYPLHYGLEAMIDKNKSYPVSVLKMKSGTLRQLLRCKIVTVSDIPESASKLAGISGIPLQQAEKIVERADNAR